jgi:hypothetical protein
MMTATLRVNQLFDRLKNEINAKAESKDQSLSLDGHITTGAPWESTSGCMFRAT